ncbi:MULTISPECIES: dTDP-glucose 4,6-dehydratase [Actinomadura]|uniref:dTDP-glucose 4,6-dehydratase n=1 Tax=Actinomadura yumaensis TaxID=111807 RepID=A0ABW2CLT6_9ACTN|nr:dTDP-glucose 4,6-dehydratase [Actinomadura sp. J1-007]MWK40692.1 dTDP-glucose 4,6-dehydratase [Actinomadura sp. J1-007]QFU19846.1 dTDP-glucose 4,6-dehydratase [Actinomadura sp.]
MNLLVTGAAGFIGSTYVRMLLAPAAPDPAAPDPVAPDPDAADPDASEEIRVTVLDKLTYAGTLDNLTLSHPRLRFVYGDICDEDLVGKLMSEADQVVHFAAESHVDNSIAAAGDFVRTNVVGTHTLLEQALAHGVRRFVHVSTDEVYGSVETGRSHETDALDPNSPYAASKAASDLLALAYHRTHGLDVRVTRCCNNYGPRQFPEKLIPLFITRLLDGQKVPLYGDGQHKRDWLHVDDHCRAIELVRTAGAPGEVYNISGHTELTNHQITGLLLEAVGGDWDQVAYVTDRKAHDRRYAVHDDKARTRLGYRPRRDFPRGLAETVAWYRHNRSWWEPLKRRAGL